MIIVAEIHVRAAKEWLLIRQMIRMNATCEICQINMCATLNYGALVLASHFYSFPHFHYFRCFLANIFNGETK